LGDEDVDAYSIMTTSPPLAIAADEFSRLMEPFTPFANKLALAVSGGPDSMALAACVKRWAQRDLIALIVEHGLRPESAAEAAQVKIQLARMSIKAEILPWTHGEIHNRLHEKAREARYNLLMQGCRTFGASDLLLAHHSGDQAETVLMRIAKGSGIDGLAGIAAQNVREGVRLLRPLLPVSKERLIATCNELGISYVTDPSNASEKYARGRLRKIMPLLAQEGLTIESLTTLAWRAREDKEALDFMVNKLLREASRTEPGGSLRLERAAFRDVPHAIGLRALAASLRYVHEDRYPPEYASLSLLLEALTGTEERARTFYGCMASFSAKRALLLREPSAASEPAFLPSGTTVLWDNRWLVTSEATAPSATIRALGLPSYNVLDALAPGLRRKIPQGRIRASLPSIWQGETLRAIPSLDGNGPYRMTFKKQAFPS
jgi:tRNA(Ile)-lysidine synthase